jgi:hypothetical protein
VLLKVAQLAAAAVVEAALPVDGSTHTHTHIMMVHVLYVRDGFCGMYKHNSVASDDSPLAYTFLSTARPPLLSTKLHTMNHNIQLLPRVCVVTSRLISAACLKLVAAVAALHTHHIVAR